MRISLHHEFQRQAGSNRAGRPQRNAASAAIGAAADCARHFRCSYDMRAESSRFEGGGLRSPTVWWLVRDHAARIGGGVISNTQAGIGNMTIHQGLIFSPERIFRQTGNKPNERVWGCSIRPYGSGGDSVIRRVRGAGGHLYAVVDV